MPMATSQTPTIESEAPQHMAPQFPGQQYLPPTAVSPTGPAPYGGLGYYPHYAPHAGSVDPYHPHPNDRFGPPMATPPQTHQPDPYTFPMPQRPVVEPSTTGEGVRKRAAEGVVAPAGAAIKRARADGSASGAEAEGSTEGLV